MKSNERQRILAKLKEKGIPISETSETLSVDFETYKKQLEEKLDKEVEKNKNDIVELFRKLQTGNSDLAFET